MARNPVTPVQPVDAVGAIRRVDSGSTYFRHLDQWRLASEVQAADRRARGPQEPHVGESEFSRALSDAANAAPPDPKR
jgi:hypothetical protein